ncbi:MAG TPA: PDZ domain-containing protein [Pyrinomonadaceae bacterium]|jgi:predicted metalloprotease with PDZ domain|nr:PDZ domain-containing protein [Pyrinomonadaceae bacterium]
MRQARAQSLALLASLLLLLSAAAASAQERGPAPEISFTVSMPRPHTHLLEVEARLRYARNAPAQLDLVMPVWTPGSYLVREYARHVQDFAADAGGGAALRWSKTNKNTWRVETGGARDVRVRYSVYSNELTVRTNELNDRHAFWNNAATLVHPDGHLAAPSTLRVVPREGWKVATGLPPAGSEQNAFRADNFDILYDSPVLASDFRVVTFEAGGRQHRFVFDGAGNYDAERIGRDARKIVEAARAIMGGELPYTDYTFLLMLGPPPGGGGLEHLNSTALIWRRHGFATEEDYRSFYGLVAHEFFHLWNVKRIRPDALGPFDYTRENYTRLLWVAEGTTEYYESVIRRRAGLITDRQFLANFAKAFQDLQNTPGRLEMSAEEASFDAWIKYYRPDENTINSAISYYDKGAILGLLLDLEIRKRSGGARSLDDVMRSLYKDFFQQNRNYTPEDFQRAAERAAGSPLEDFFRRFVRGREELDYNAALEAAGLRLDTASDKDGKPAPESAYLGATLAQEGDRLTLRNVPAGTPAYEQGLSANDQIVAIDGYRAARDFLDFFNARLAGKRPGDTVAVTVFRADELRTFNVKLGARADATYRIVPVRQPTPEQARVYEQWLAAPFPRQGQ